MNVAEIVMLCNEIEDRINQIYNESRTDSNRQIQYSEYSMIILRMKEIAAEISAKPETNGDRIRSMTDEQLVEYLRCKSCICQNEPDCEHTDCRAGILAWLRKDVSEDAESDTEEP